jgi:septal ring-binding cell division protein DamX
VAGGFSYPHAARTKERVKQFGGEVRCASIVEVESRPTTCVRCAMELTTLSPLPTALGGAPREAPQQSHELSSEPMRRFAVQLVSATAAGLI